jgi:hypothetical protein
MVVALSIAINEVKFSKIERYSGQPALLIASLYCKDALEIL